VIPIFARIGAWVLPRASTVLAAVGLGALVDDAVTTPEDTRPLAAMRSRIAALAGLVVVVAVVAAVVVAVQWRRTGRRAR
jgi:hypothetical protein